MSIKRYDWSGGWEETLVPRADGDWMRYDDHVAELARRVPNPDDLRMVLSAVPESRLVEVDQDEDGEMVFPATPVGHAYNRVRATLEETE